MWNYNATLVRVIDGDTIVLDIDLGFYITIRQHVRLDGINAPEKNTAEGMAAAHYLAQQIPVGTAIVTTTKKIESADKYGRFLARVSTAMIPDVAAMMIETGHAVEYHGGPR